MIPGPNSTPSPPTASSSRRFPIAVGLLLVLRHYGLVAKVSGFIYVGALLGVQVSSQLVERLHGAVPGSWRLHLRVAVHVAGVTGFIYVSGWGPVFGMAYAFTAFTDMQECGARAWRPALTWSLVGCAAGQLCVWRGWMPSMLAMSASQTVGLLGAFVFGIAIRMAGAVGVQKRRS